MSLAGGISTLIWALIVIVIIVVILVVLFKVINLLFIAPIINEVSATPAAYTETVGHVSLARGFVVSLTPVPSFSLHLI